MTSDEKKAILENLDKVLKSFDTTEENVVKGLEASLKLDPNYEHRLQHEDSIQQIRARRDELLKQRQQIVELPVLDPPLTEG